MRNAAVVVAAVLLFALGVPAAGQQSTRRTVLGVVRDSATGFPLGGALIRLGRQQIVTDSAGRFRIEAVPDGPATFTLAQLGYATRIVTVLVGDDTPPLALALAPEPVPLPAISVVADSVLTQRLAARRWSLPVASRAYGRKTLRESNAQDMHSFVATRTGLQPGQCLNDRVKQVLRSRGPFPQETHSSSGWTGCIWKQGAVVRSLIYIDEKPIPVDKLHDYAPREMFLLEVYADGAMIRGYTNAWVGRTRAERLQTIP